MDIIEEAKPAQQARESIFRLALRLALDAIGFAAFTTAAMLLLAASIAIGDAAMRGLAQFQADLAAIEDFPTGYSQENMVLGGFVIGALFYLCVAAAVFAIARLRGGTDWRDYLAWKPFEMKRAYLLIAALGIAWGMGIGSLIETLHPEAKNWFVFPRGVVGGFVSFALVVVLGPLCEELLFRGWLYTALRPRLGFIATLLATSCLFAAAHWESTHLYALAVLPTGLLLGYIREKSGSIRSTFVFHGVYNLAGWLLAAIAGK